MKYSNSDKENTNIYDQPMVSQVPYGVVAPRPGRGVFGLFISVAIVFVIIIIILFPTLFESNNDDVSYSGLGISYRFQSRGDLIYYAEYNFPDYPGTLWRVSSDGEEKEKIIESDVDLYDLYGDQILYITHSDNDEWILHTVDIEGNNEEILYQSDEESSHIIKIDAASGKCYALDRMKLHIIDLNNGKVSEFEDDVLDFCIDGEWVYYVKTTLKNDEYLAQLWRANLFGTGNEQLMNSFESAVDYSDNKIYYINEEDGDIYSVDFAGENEKKIIESEGAFFIKVIGDWIYYANVDENPCVYKVNKNGKQNQKIDGYGMRMGFSIYFTCILDNWVWYGDVDDSFVSYTKMIRISDKHDTDDLIEDILDDMTPSWVIRKYE